MAMKTNMYDVTVRVTYERHMTTTAEDETSAESNAAGILEEGEAASGLDGELIAFEVTDVRLLKQERDYLDTNDDEKRSLYKKLQKAYPALAGDDVDAVAKAIYSAVFKYGTRLRIDCSDYMLDEEKKPHFVCDMIGIWARTTALRK